MRKQYNLSTDTEKLPALTPMTYFLRGFRNANLNSKDRTQRELFVQKLKAVEAPSKFGADFCLLNMQAITLEQALPIFTINGARSLGMEKDTGTLSSGKWADFIVLDKPLHDMSADDIASVDVQQTIWKGKQVYSR